MKTINQRGMTLRQYDEQHRNGSRAPSGEPQPSEFEDDAVASRPSRIDARVYQASESPKVPSQQLSITRTNLGFLQCFGYALVFVMYGVIGIVAVVIGASSGPTPNAPIPTAFVFLPIVMGVLGVIVQYKINQRRNKKRMEKLTRRQ